MKVTNYIFIKIWVILTQFIDICNLLQLFTIGTPIFHNPRTTKQEKKNVSVAPRSEYRVHHSTKGLISVYTDRRTNRHG